jgi:hypothetical protein
VIKLNAFDNEMPELVLHTTQKDYIILDTKNSREALVISRETGSISFRCKCPFTMHMAHSIKLS